MLSKIQSYEILERVGIGGMGVVYKARHAFRNEIVAIKSLSPQYCHDPQIRERFINEARILNKLNHPNIVKVVDFIQDVDDLHLIMQFAEGKTLDKIIGREVGPIPYERALPLFMQILEAISYAHNNGVIHRDLKPSNIIVHDGKALITDFGIAKITGNTGFTKTGTKMGTIYYMSPEQIRGMEVDEQSDIYSLGMTLYEMLAGRLPFDKSSDASEFYLMHQIVNQELPDPRKFYPAIPEWLVNIIQKAIAKNKNERIRNCLEFFELLKKEPGKVEVRGTTVEVESKKPIDIIKEPANIIRAEKSSRHKSKRNKPIPIAATIFILSFIGLAIFILLRFANKKLIDAEEIKTFTGHSDWILSVAFTPDGKYLASGNDDNTIKLWDVETGKEIKTFAGHSRTVWSVAFSPDGNYLASGSGDKTIKLWDVETGNEIKTLTGNSFDVRSVAFSPDGKYLANGSADLSIILWKLIYE